MQYLYKIGYYSEEDSAYYELSHDKLFTSAELDKSICQAAVAIVKRRKEDKDSIHNFSDIISDIVNWLIENEGFVRVKYDLTWNCFGWASIFSAEDWGENYKDDNRVKIVKALQDAGYSEMDDTHLRWDIEVERLDPMTIDELRAEYPDLCCDGMDKDHYVLAIIDFIRFGRMPKAERYSKGEKQCQSDSL